MVPCNPQKKQIEIFTWKKFDKACHYLAQQIYDSDLKFDFVQGIPRGGSILAIRLSYLLDIPFFSDGNPLLVSNPVRILICDDISDTGKTLLPFKNKGFKIATIHSHPHSEVEPDFYVHLKKNRLEKGKWIQYAWEGDIEGNLK